LNTFSHSLWTEFKPNLQQNYNTNRSQQQQQIHREQQQIPQQQLSQAGYWEQDIYAHPNPNYDYPYHTYNSDYIGVNVPPTIPFPMGINYNSYFLPQHVYVEDYNMINNPNNTRRNGQDRR
jgi:hypothetical protein